MPEEYNQKTQGNGQTELTKAARTEAKIDATQTAGAALDRQAAGSKIPGLHTLKGDIASYIKERDLSLAEIASQPRKYQPPEQEIEKTSKKIFIVIGLVAILVVGMGIGSYYLFFNKETAVETPANNSSQTFIIADKKEIIELNSEKPEEIINSIKKFIEAPTPQKAITIASFFYGQQSIGGRKFLELLKISPPASFMQSLEEDFIFGVHRSQENNPFLIFKMRDFDLAFSGALEWEKGMARDLKNVLTISVIPNHKFQDAIIKNIDSRILYGDENNPVLVYAFFNRQYLVISVNADTFNEITRRLSVAK